MEGEDIYAGVADTEEQASHLREPCDGQRQVGNACDPSTRRLALSARSPLGRTGQPDRLLHLCLLSTVAACWPLL